MSVLRTIRRNLTRVAQEGPMEISRVALAEFPATSEEGPRLILLMYTNEHLSQRVLTLPRYRYPLQLLMNTWLMYTAVIDQTRHGELRLRPNELGTAALAGIPTGANYGPVIDESNVVLRTPPAEFGADLSMIRQPSPAQIWGTALVIPYWPAFQSERVSSHKPELFVVHLPDREMTEEEERKIATIAIGYNYCDIADTTGLVNNTILELREAVAAAQVIAGR